MVVVRSVLVGQVTTGRRLTQLPVVAATWSCELNGAGQMSATLKLDDPRVSARPELLLALEPARSFMAVLEGDEVLEGGPIWAHAYDDKKKLLTIRGAGERSVFDHRIVMKTLAPGEDPATSSLTFNGALADMARDLIRQALESGVLPIVVGADEGGDQTRTYPGFDAASIAARIDELSGVIGGPDIALDAHLTEDRQGIEWQLRTGTTADPLLHQPGSSATETGGDHVWDSQAPKSGITTLDVDRDATRMAGRWFATGQGAGQAQIMSIAQDDDRVAHGWPLLEGTSSYQSVEEEGTLDKHAASDLGAALRPWTTWTLTVRADKNPKLGVYRPGDWSRIWVPATHPYLAAMLRSVGGTDRFYRARILSFSGDLKPSVKIAFAPTMEAR